MCRSAADAFRAIVLVCLPASRAAVKRWVPVAFFLVCSSVAAGEVSFAGGGVTKGTGVALSCDVPVGASIDPAADHDFFSFSVGAGEIVTIKVVADPAAPTITTFWRLLIDGMPASSCGSSTIADRDDCGPFAEAPTGITLEVEDFFNDEVGDYAVHLQRLPFATACDQLPLTDDVTVDATIDHFTDSDLFSFCATEGAIVRTAVIADPAAPTITPFWRLIDFGGSPAADCGSFTIGAEDDCGPLPEAGNPYRVQVEEFFHDETGDYTVVVFALAGTLVACPPIPFIFGDGFESGDTSNW